MSVHLTSQAWKIDGVTALQKLVLVKLADNANDAGECWPSVSRMAAECCCSKRSVIRSILDLESANLIRVSRGGRGTQNKYRLTLKSGVTQSPVPHSHQCHTVTSTGDTQSPGGDRQSPELVTHSHSNRKGTVNNRHLTVNTPKPPNGRPAEFQRWYNSYPKKVAPDAAVKAWKNRKRAGTLPPVEELIEAVQRQEQSKQWKSGYIPNPATWLNQGRWDDETETPKMKTDYGKDGDRW